MALNIVTYTKWLIVVLIPVIFIFASPDRAKAGLFTFISDILTKNTAKQEATVSLSNSQTMALLQTGPVSDLKLAMGGGDINIIDGTALLSENGPSGTVADIENSNNNGRITTYIVRSGDTLSAIAKMFGVSVNTIIWANDVTAKTIKEGQKLVILPVSGVMHTVAKGETINSIAKKYKGDVGEILQFNGLESDVKLAIGDSIIIPDGESGTVGNITKTSVSSANVTAKLHDANGPSYDGYYARPLSGGVKTQGLHGYNAVDFGVKVGTPILASASGQVIISRSSGWNSGYGQYVVISHYNGTQTLYAHLSENLVSEGDTVFQGQIIGLSGNTGKSTGPHLHFEIRGAKNPF